LQLLFPDYNGGYTERSMLKSSRSVFYSLKANLNIEAMIEPSKIEKKKEKKIRTGEIKSILLPNHDKAPILLSTRIRF
jgi:hypothetical protein